MPKKSKKVVAKDAKTGKKLTFEDDDEPLEEVSSHTEQDGEELTKEEYRTKIEAGEAEEDVYTDEGRAELEEDDEIEPWEEGFSKGAQPDRHHK